VRLRSGDRAQGARGAPRAGVAGLFALQAHNDRNIQRRNLCLAGVGVAVLMLILISLLPVTYNRLIFSLYS
jgi:hypothetical protein